MKKILEDELFRGIMITVLGVMMLLVVGNMFPYAVWNGKSHLLHLPDDIMGFVIIAGFLLFSTIIRSAGHYRGKEEVTPNYFDEYPLETYIIGDGIIFLRGMAVFGIFQDWLMPLGIFGLGVMYLSAIFFCMSFAVRCKTGTLLTNTLVYKSYDGVKQFFIRQWKNFEFYVDNLPLYWEIAVIVFVLVSLPVLFGGLGAILSLCGTVIFVLFLIRMTVAYKNIETGIEKIAGGDTGYQIDVRKMPNYMKKQAENLNNINNVVGDAVFRRVKSEQFKTELITNVSHDIKTPLTSIINYIDLIDKENVTRQPMADYVAVLKRQSNRLKKLIEDLVEASKASTGNIAVNLSSTGLNILLNQAVAEYTEKAAAAGLELSVSMPEKEIYILSDGRLLWRVFDNLLNNACKYSRPGTRVYINLANDENNATISFKNISKQALNISADELMERFVRGDSSRNTEGSGLGLSIARSLTDILGGVMKLDIEGDMFKAILTFPVI